MEPTAYYVQRIAPGSKDDGARMCLTFKKEEAEEWVDEIHTLKALYHKNLENELQLAYWVREWSGEKDPVGGRMYHSNKVELDLEVVSGQKSQFIENLRDLSKMGPMETAPGQWMEVVPLIQKI